MANMHWNITNTSSGMLPAVSVSRVMPWRNALSNPPITHASGFPDSTKLVSNAQLYPKAIHKMLTTPTMKRVCIMTLNTFFWRTKPP